MEELVRQQQSQAREDLRAQRHTLQEEVKVRQQQRQGREDLRAQRHTLQEEVKVCFPVPRDTGRTPSSCFLCAVRHCPIHHAAHCHTHCHTHCTTHRTTHHTPLIQELKDSLAAERKVAMVECYQQGRHEAESEAGRHTALVGV